MTVEVEEFAGAWLPLPPDQRTRLGAHGAWCRLGVDAAAGVRAWDPQARDHPAYRPARPARRSSGCCRTGLRCIGWCHWSAPMSASSWALRSIRCWRRSEVPPLRLNATADPPPRLGWNTWVPGPARRFTRAGRCGGRDLRGGSDRGAAGRLAQAWSRRHERLGRRLRHRHHLHDRLLSLSSRRR